MILDTEADEIRSTNAKKRVMTTTTVTTEIEAFLTCSFVGLITLLSSSFAFL